MSATVIVNSFNEEQSTFMATMKSIEKASPGQIILSTVEGQACIGWVNRQHVDVVISSKPGIFSQLNKSVSHIKEDYVCYASSNDIMYSNKLELEEALLKKNNKKICYSAYDIKKTRELRSSFCQHIMGDKNRPQLASWRRTFSAYNYQRHLAQNFVSDCALVEAGIFKKYTPFKEEYNNSAYHDLWLRIYEGEGDVFLYNPIPTWRYIVTPNSRHMSVQKDRIRKAQKYADRRRMLRDHVKGGQNCK